MNESERAMHSIISDTVSRNDIDELKDVLQELADVANSSQAVSTAALELLTAVNYKDGVLVESAFESLLVALAAIANEYIAKELAASEGTKTGINEAWNQHIDRKAYDIAVFDEVKDRIESLIDNRVSNMQGLRQLVGKLKKLGKEVEKAQSLEDGIRSLRTFRENLLRKLPSRKPPSPINKDTVDKARDAIRRGEKGLTKHELVWGRKPDTQ